MAAASAASACAPGGYRSAAAEATKTTTTSTTAAAAPAVDEDEPFEEPWRRLQRRHRQLHFFKMQAEYVCCVNLGVERPPTPRAENHSTSKKLEGCRRDVDPGAAESRRALYRHGPAREAHERADGHQEHHRIRLVLARSRGDASDPEGRRPEHFEAAVGARHSSLAAPASNTQRDRPLSL